MTKLSFSIPGEPKGKDRARGVPAIVWKDGEPEAIVRFHTPKETVEAEKLIRDLFWSKFPRHRLWTGAVLIRFTAVFETPKSFNKTLQAAARAGELHCIKKPDKDNIEKLICDALKGVAWVDDAQVMGGGIKRYGGPARVDVTLELLQTPDQPRTPGQLRTEARIAREEAGDAPRPAQRFQTKSNTRKYPPALRARIDAALDREGSTTPAQRGLFGDGKR